LEEVMQVRSRRMEGCKKVQGAIASIWALENLP